MIKGERHFSVKTDHKKCLYCMNMTNAPHFVSRCCGRGMCEECYQGQTEHDEQAHIDNMDDQDYQKYVLAKVYPYQGDYICFEHVKQ